MTRARKLKQQIQFHCDDYCYLETPKNMLDMNLLVVYNKYWI
jgi:hypothetical protein